MRFNSVVFFFFQAEDGIRDFHVTGVQTCALPICKREFILLGAPRRRRPADIYAESGTKLTSCCARKPASTCALKSMAAVRRADRKSVRVGKECRCGWWSYH